jgi:hypothetical protein
VKQHPESYHSAFVLTHGFVQISEEVVLIVVLHSLNIVNAVVWESLEEHIADFLVALVSGSERGSNRGGLMRREEPTGGDVISKAASRRGSWRLSIVQLRSVSIAHLSVDLIDMWVLESYWQQPDSRNCL